MENPSESTVQIVYFGHGGGPLPILGDPGHRSMLYFLSRLPGQLKKPDAILVISAHWEEPEATLLGAESPPMFYDYYGFPDEAYAIQYPALGNPELAGKIADKLMREGIPAQINPQRGFDHGVFIPLKMMYPQADIPCTQLSLLRGLDAAKHLDLGKALRGLNVSNLLVIGSGFSFHNLQAFEWESESQPDAANDAFQNWLIETCTAPIPPLEREQRLIHWQQAPSARYCHPREEHLLPLHVCAGMAAKAGKLVYDDYILGKRNVGFLWEGG